MPTIAALASGRPPAAIAIIRVSGPQALTVVEALAGSIPAPRRLSLRNLRAADGAVLDRALVAIFPGPATATGEDVAEFHLHGGAAVIAAVLAAITALPDVRLAEPGEFTRRAFAGGRLDLAEVEGLADLVAAETDAQRRQALALAGGALSRAADQWRERSLAVLAEAEAGLDFAEDEGDVAARIDTATQATLCGFVAELESLLDDARRGARLRDGLTIVVTGPPNVGKSSLVNALSERDAAIVAPLAGTTRDTIEVAIDLDGIAAVLIDTAGLRETDDPIEAEGIRRARARAADADLVIRVTDATSSNAGSLRIAPGPGLDVVNKTDLHGADAGAGSGAWRVSATRGDGLPELRAYLAEWAAGVLRPGEPALLSHARHSAAFVDAAEALRDAAATDDAVLRAESLRRAAQAFGRIAGRVGVEDVLDRIFARFCIGK